MLSADVHRRVQQHLQFNHAGTFVPIPQSNGSGKIAACTVARYGQLVPVAAQLFRVLPGPAGSVPAIIEG